LAVFVATVSVADTRSVEMAASVRYTALFEAAVLEIASAASSQPLPLQNSCSKLPPIVVVLEQVLPNTFVLQTYHSYLYLLCLSTNWLRSAVEHWRCELVVACAAMQQKQKHQRLVQVPWLVEARWDYWHCSDLRHCSDCYCCSRCCQQPLHCMRWDAVVERLSLPLAAQLAVDSEVGGYCSRRMSQPAAVANMHSNTQRTDLEALDVHLDTMANARWSRQHWMEVDTLPDYSTTQWMMRQLDWQWTKRQRLVHWRQKQQRLRLHGGTLQRRRSYTDTSTKHSSAGNWQRWAVSTVTGWRRGACNLLVPQRMAVLLAFDRLQSAWDDARCQEVEDL